MVELPQYARLIWPAIDRAFIAGVKAGALSGRELVRAYGGRAIGYMIDLRNPLAAGRPVTDAGIDAVYRYWQPQARRETVQRSIDHGLLQRDAAGALIPTATGRTFLRELFELHATVLTRRWQEHAERVDRLNRLLAQVLAAAESTGGPAWAAQAPPYEPAGTAPGVVLLNRLSTMRYHRADAHAAAWQQVGLTAADMPDLPPGPQREAIEADTDQRAAPPYAGLTADQRWQLLADLAALP